MKKVSLTVVDGPDRGATFSFSEGSCSIGRGRGELTLSDKKVSGRHLRVWLEGDRVMVEDLGSTNGSFLSGRKLTKPEILKNLDSIFVGLSKINVSILEDLSSFKSQNTDANFISSSSAVIDVDDLDSSRDDEVLGSLFEDSMSGAGSSKTAHVSASEVADMLEDERTVKAPSLPASSKPVDVKPVSLAAVEIPPEDARYKETGIQRISNLIKDELGTFSQWDDPQLPESQKSSAMVPTIKVKLKLRRGPEGVASVDCSQPVTTFGRKDVDVRLNDLDVSRKHSAIEIVAGDKVFVRDLGSSNGTFVNGKKISHQELNPGDLIQMGQSILEFSIEGKKKQ